MKLSIIIPVYNVEKYIRGTLNSIYAQHYSEEFFEVIIVDDGTPDNSMEIVNEFVSHQNLHVLRQENKGLSCARNAGLNMARGDYVWFVDSDDQIVDNSLSKISEIINNQESDVFAFDMICIKESDGTETVEEVLFNSKENYGKISRGVKLWKKAHICPAQRFLYRRGFLLKNNLTFYPKILHEDEEIAPRIFANAEKFLCLPISLYKYLIRDGGSIMSETYNQKSIDSSMQICENLKKYAKFESDVIKASVYYDAIFKILSATFEANNGVKKDLMNYIKHNKAHLKKEVSSSYFNSFRYYNSVGKTYKLFKLMII